MILAILFELQYETKFDYQRISKLELVSILSFKVVLFSLLVTRSIRKIIKILVNIQCPNPSRNLEIISDSLPLLFDCRFVGLIECRLKVNQKNLKEEELSLTGKLDVSL